MRRPRTTPGRAAIRNSRRCTRLEARSCRDAADDRATSTSSSRAQRGSIDPDTEEMNTVFQEAGFQGSGVDTRFFGETHTPGSSPHVVSSFVELESEDGATSALDWLETDSTKPCPMSCAAGDKHLRRGWHSGCTRRPADLNGRGHREGWESPTNGPPRNTGSGSPTARFVHTVNLLGPPGSVSRSRLWRSRARITTGLRAASARGPRRGPRWPSDRRPRNRSSSSTCCGPSTTATHGDERPGSPSPAASTRSLAWGLRRARSAIYLGDC